MATTDEDDLTIWRLRFASWGSFSGRPMTHIATAPGCPNDHHHFDYDCNCQTFISAFAARKFIQEQNRLLARRGPTR